MSRTFFKRFLFSFFIVSFLLVPSIEASRLATKEEMITHLESIRHLFETQYAPADWKQEQFGWSIDQEIEQAKQEILKESEVSLKKYQRILKRIFTSTRDHHVNIIFYSTESAQLPLSVKGVAGKYYITSIDYDKIPPGSFPIEIGDELLTFNEQPADQMIKELAKQEGNGDPSATYIALAEIKLTNRSGMTAAIIPKGSVMLKLRSQKDGSSYQYKMIWDYQPEIFVDQCFGDDPLEQFETESSLTDHNRLAKQMLLPSYTHLRKDVAGDKNPNKLGQKVSFLPPLGKKVWSTGLFDIFDAYIFLTDTGKKIGYVRIPTYSLEGNTESIYRRHVEAFSNIIKRMEEQTDALVIDQLNNPGGTVHYLYSLASTLSDRPLRTPTHRIKINQTHYLEALADLKLYEGVDSDQAAKAALSTETVCGYPVSYQFVQFILNYHNQIINEWKNGHYYTSPQHLWGVDFINPHPTIRYTKPILFLINELDFSGGDFMPAILQDNKRATLFGAQTAGAGGYITAARYPNRYGIAKVYLTGSLAKRLDNSCIESTGVKPDIPYEVTKDDVVNGYQDYAEAVLEAVEQLVEESNE